MKTREPTRASKHSGADQQQRLGFRVLTIVLLLFVFVIYPLLADSDDWRHGLDLAFSAVLLASIGGYAWHKGKMLAAGLVLVTLALAGRWAVVFLPGSDQPVFGQILAILFLGLTAGVILRRVLESRRVTGDTVWGSVAVYLLIGIIWSVAYTVVEDLRPGSFDFANEEAATELPGERFLYFSYVTLTTLGYGDVTPVSRGAMSLAMLEAIVGQLFLAILIARLVGLHVAQSES